MGWAERDADRQIERQEEAEQNEFLVDRYYTALLSISKSTCCDRCQEAALVAKKALEEA